MSDQTERMLAEEKARSQGRRVIPRKNTTDLSNEYAKILENISPEVLATFPRTPEEKAAAKKRLETQIYKCNICQDSKFVHPRTNNGKVDYTRTIPCICVRKKIEEKLKKQMLNYCEIPSDGMHMTFEKFKRSTYLEEGYQACLLLAEEKDSHWITLIGNSTVGKTHLGMAVCHRWLARNKPAKYAYVPLLLEELKAAFKGNGDESYTVRYNTFLNVPLLFLDDLGVQSDTAWAQEHLDTIVDYRLIHNLPLVVTTNLPKSQLSFRIAHRLERGGKIITIKAPKFEVKQ